MDKNAIFTPKIQLFDEIIGLYIKSVHLLMVESIYGRNPLKNNGNTAPQKAYLQKSACFGEKTQFSHKNKGSRWGHLCAYHGRPPTEGFQKWSPNMEAIH